MGVWEVGRWWGGVGRERGREGEQGREGVGCEYTCHTSAVSSTLGTGKGRLTSWRFRTLKTVLG